MVKTVKELHDYFHQMSNDDNIPKKLAGEVLVNLFNSYGKAMTTENIQEVIEELQSVFDYLSR